MTKNALIEKKKIELFDQRIREVQEANNLDEIVDTGPQPGPRKADQIPENLGVKVIKIGEPAPNPLSMYITPNGPVAKP